MTANVTETAGYWWCRNCNEELDASRVTHQERHDTCGHPTTWIEIAGEDNDDENLGPACSTPAYIAAEHRAQIRVGNASSGVQRISDLVKLGTLPQSSLDAARGELESARDALGAIHRTPVGQNPADPVRALHAEVAEVHRDGASSNDLVQLLDDWFVAQGLPTVIYT